MSETTFDEPAGTTHRCGKAWGGLRSLGARSISTFNTWRKRMDQNSLERALAQIIETANGHRAKGLPKGSPAYLCFAIRRPQRYRSSLGSGTWRSQPSRLRRQRWPI